MGDEEVTIRLDYGAQNNGQIQTLHVYNSPGVENSFSPQSYGYDAWGRLKTAATAGPTGAPTWKLGFVYDRYGNRTQQNLLAGSGFATQTPTDPVTNRLASPNVYDASGNLINDTLHTYTYDAENRIKTVDSTAATYTGACPERSRRNGGPLRVKEVASGATVVRIYSGSNMLAYYVNGALSSEFVYAGNTQLAQVLPGGTRLYSHPDHLSNRVLTNQSGGVEWTGGHYPFGENWYQPIGNTPWRFTSYLRYSESGLDYAIFRNYSSRLGKFAQADPLGGGIIDPQSQNRYSYVENDPSNLRDPLGLNFMPIIWFCKMGPVQFEIEVVEEGVARMVTTAWDTTCQMIGINGEDPLDLVRKALQKKECRELFSKDVDPMALLTNILAGNYGLNQNKLGFDDLGGKNDKGEITNAKTDASDYTYVGTSSQGEVVPSGVTITINSNPAAVWTAGRPGMTMGQNRAVTLIHELGHAAEFLHPGSTKLPHQQDANDPKKSTANSKLIFETCLK